MINKISGHTYIDTERKDACLGKKLSLKLLALAVLLYLLSKLKTPAPSDLEKEEITNIRAL